MSLSSTYDIHVGDLVRILATGKILAVAHISEDGTIRTAEEEPQYTVIPSTGHRLYSNFWAKYRLGDYEKVYSV